MSIYRGQTITVTKPSFSKREALVNATFLPDIGESFKRMAEGKEAIGLAKELDQETRHLNPNLPVGRGLSLPLAELSRALSTSIYSAGGATVGSNFGGLDTLPRANGILAAGATLIEGLPGNTYQDATGTVTAFGNGNLTIPREVGEVTFNFYNEADAVTLTDSSFGTLNLTPHRIAGGTSVSGQFEAQSPFGIRMLIESMLTGLEVGLNDGALNGNGIAGDVMGLFNQAGVATQTYSGAAAWSHVTETVETVATANGNEAAMGWVTHPNVRQKWANAQRFTGTDATLWDVDRDTVAGKRAVVSTNCPNTSAIFGDWQRYYVAVFGVGMPVNVLVDNCSLADTGRIKLIVQALADVGTTRPGLFVKNSGSVVQ